MKLCFQCNISGIKLWRLRGHDISKCFKCWKGVDLSFDIQLHRGEDNYNICYLLINGKLVTSDSQHIVTIPSIRDSYGGYLTVFEMTQEILDEWKALPITVEDLYKVGSERYKQGFVDFQEIVKE